MGQPLAGALSALKENGNSEWLLEAQLLPLPIADPWQDLAPYLVTIIALVVAIPLGDWFWNRALRREVKLHTERLALTLAEKQKEIKQREHTERQLRETSARHESLVNSVDCIVWEADAATFNFTYVSPRAERMLGYPVGEWHKPGFWLDHLHPEDRATAVKLSSEATRKGENHNFEYRMVHKEGHSIWVRDLVTVLVENGQVSKLRGLILDVDQLKRAEEALRESELLTRLVIDTALDAVVQMDERGLIIDWNPQAESLFGWTRREVEGKRLSLILLPDPFRRTHHDRLAHYLATGQDPILNHLIDVHARHRNGHEFPAELAISPVHHKGQISFTAFIRDISVRKQSELQLAEARDQALRASQLKSEFLATMSHEIRTPMNGVLGMAGLLLQTPLNAEQREYAQTVKNSGEALLNIINDILDFSKIEAGKLELEPEPFELESAVCEVAELLAGQAAAKGLQLHVEIAPNLPRRLVGDAGRIRQILLNLTGNAIKFTEEGHVHIEASCVLQSDDSALVRLAVHDSGIGISEHDRSLLFQKFTQLDASATRRFGGTGLGLAITRQLVELMNGVVAIESQIGKGSTFLVEFRLPIHTSSGQPEPNPAIAQSRVLLLCAHQIRQRTLANHLRFHGIGLQTAVTVQEAIDAIAKEDFHAVLCDLDSSNDSSPGRIVKVLPANAGLILLAPIHETRPAEEIAKGILLERLSRPVRPSALVNALGRIREAQLTGKPNGAAHPAISQAATQLANRLHVLLVEDNAINQRVAIRALEKLGCLVDLAVDGLEALDMTGRIQYDLLFMDCHMPRMDGYQATAEIRKREEGTGRHTPIVAVTANAMKGDREKCLLAGMDDYLSKPIDMQNLRRILVQIQDSDLRAS
ncbi:MAG: PAS domain S-box protein [Acidobacteriia bacterium]|nr:PAS domain S-box protein [Terriglobia bacterium]